MSQFFFLLVIQIRRLPDTTGFTPFVPCFSKSFFSPIGKVFKKAREK
jgi:hypothetical protein